MERRVFKKFLGLIIVTLILLVLPSAVKAAYIRVTPSTTTANPNQTISVTISSDCTGKVGISTSSGWSGSTWIEGGGSSTVSIPVGSSGTTSISATAIDMSNPSDGKAMTPSAGSASVVINSGNSGSTTGSNSGSNTNTPAAKSNVTTLSNLGIRPNDFSGFRAAKTSYSTEVPNDVESIEIYANKGQNGQTITGTGKKTLQEGTNTFNIVVTAEDGTSKKTYTLTVNRKAKDDTNNTTENSTINDDAIDNEISNEMDNTNEFENNIIEDNEAGNVVGNNNSNLQKENTIIIAIIAVIIIIIIIILIVEAIKKKRMKGEDDDEYQDIYDDNENNEINDFDTSSVPVALQGNEDKIENPKEEEKENKIDENLNSTIIQEPEENKEIEASEPKLDNEEPKKELKEMFEDEERPRRKGHSKGKRFK